MAASVTRLSAANFDVDALRQHYAATLKPAYVDPANGMKSISAEDLHVSLDGFDIWKGGCSSGMRVTFSEPPDLFAVYLPIDGAMEFRGMSRTRASTPGSLLVCDFSRTEQMTLHPGRRHVGIGFDRKTMIGQLSEYLETPVNPDFELSGELAIANNSGDLSSLCALLGGSIDGDPESASLRSTTLLLRGLLMRLLERVPHQYSNLMARPPSPALPRHAKVAIDFMMANADAPLSIDEIASASGVSIRTLQAAFRQFRDTTPVSFFRRVRLEKAREQILAEGEAGVSAIARKWGFSNVGRFSTMYLETFGETPRETLARKSRR